MISAPMVVGVSVVIVGVVDAESGEIVVGRVPLINVVVSGGFSELL